MIKANNIAIKLILLIAITLVLAGTRYASAQNTGASPYLDSEHAYQVKVGKAANTKEWKITDKLAIPTEITLTDALTYAEIADATTDGGNEVITLYFDHTVFTHTGLWYLQYFEYNGGTSNCVSSREFVINIVDNTFYLSLPVDDVVCNDESDSVHTYSEVTSTSYPTEVTTYTVTMHKEAGFKPSQWYFKAQFDQAVVAGSFSASIAATDGVITTTESAGVYTVTVVPVGNAQTSVPITITSSFNHAINSANSPVLTVSGGKAVVAGTPPAITDDNLITNSDRVQMVTVNAVPETNDIMPGDNETTPGIPATSSASFPMQNSTHKYKVAMGDYATNYGYAGTGWYVESPLTPGVALTTGLSVTRAPKTGSTSTDTVSVAFTTLPTGNYILYFKEQNTNSCSTVRAYPFTLGEPFDVDIAAVGSDCSGADQKIYDDSYSAPITESTLVTYSINLTNADYDATWQFNLQLACSEFDGSELVATDANISVTGGSIGTIARSAGLITIPVVVAKVAATPLNRAVSVSVTYSGIYATAHNITATLVPPASPASFGSYNEVDKDNGVVLDATESNEGSINITTHTIYAIPQAGILAGVD